MCSFQGSQQTPVVLQHGFSVVKPWLMSGWENALWFSSSIDYIHAQVTPGEMCPRASAQELLPCVSSPLITPISLMQFCADYLWAWVI